MQQLTEEMQRLKSEKSLIRGHSRSKSAMVKRVSIYNPEGYHLEKTIEGRREVSEEEDDRIEALIQKRDRKARGSKLSST